MKNPSNVAPNIFKKKDIVDQFYLLFQKKFPHHNHNVLKINESDHQKFLNECSQNQLIEINKHSLPNKRVALGKNCKKL